MTPLKRGVAWFSGLSLDLKLGFRMLVKYPGLTVVGGLAMEFGIWFGAVAFQMFGLVMSPKLPLPDGDRIVRIQNWDSKTLQDEDRVTSSTARRGRSRTSAPIATRASTWWAPTLNHIVGDITTAKSLKAMSRGSDKGAHGRAF